MVVLNGTGLIVISSVFKVQTDYFLIFKYVCFELCAILGISSLQQFISCFIKNSLAAAAVGFCGSIGSYMFAQSQILSKVIPYSNILITVPFGDERDAYVGLAFSIASGILWLAVGIFEFNKRDIK